MHCLVRSRARAERSSRESREKNQEDEDGDEDEDIARSAGGRWTEKDSDCSLLMAESLWQIRPRLDRSTGCASHKV